MPDVEEREGRASRILVAAGILAGGPSVRDDELSLRPGRWRRIYRGAAVILVAYPVAVLLGSHVAPVDVLLAFIATGLFTALLLTVGRSKAADPRRHAPLFALLNLALVAAAAALVLSARESGWFAAFYYASASASMLRPRNRALMLISIAGATGGISVYLVRGDPTTAIIQAVSVAVVGFVALSVAELRRTNTMLVDARRELAALAVAEERNRIARDLHDTLGHTLSLITLKSELAGRLVETDPDRARAEIGDVERVARDALASVRETVSGYRMPTLSAELAAAREALTAADIGMLVDADVGSLPAPVDAVLAWTIREATTNVIRHSGAHTVTIRVRRHGRWAAAEVADDGRGATAQGQAEGDAAGGATGDVGGSGLTGLAERIGALGGAFEAGSPPGGGFRLEVRLPLEVGA